MDRKNEKGQMNMDTPCRDVTEDTKSSITEDREDKTSSEGDMEESREPRKVCVPYCIYNLSYEHHSYISKGKQLLLQKRKKVKMKFLMWKK